MGIRVESQCQPEIRTVYNLVRGRVPDGVLSRAIQHGGIPTEGPGSHSLLNALEAIREPISKEKTLQERRQHNRALFPRNY